MRSRTRSFAALRYVFAAATLCCATTVFAADVRWSGSLALTSDYLHRGISLTRGEPALQTGLAAEVNRTWHVGVWASTVDLNAGEGATYEIDAYLARSWTLSPAFTSSLALTHYAYPNDTPYVRYDYDEVAATLSYRSLVSTTVAWSPNLSARTHDYVLREDDVWSYELTATYPLTRALSLNSGMGWRDVRGLLERAYWYGHAGMQFSSGNLNVYVLRAHADDTAKALFGRDRITNGWTVTALWSFGSSD